MTWTIEKDIREAQLNKHDPSTGPPERLFISVGEGKVLDLIHTSNIICRPDINHKLFFTKRHFWWPSLNNDIKEFIVARPTCAQNESSNQPPVGLLQPLHWSSLVPHHNRCSSLVVIITINDRFSKAAHFVPLSKLPGVGDCWNPGSSHVPSLWYSLWHDWERSLHLVSALTLDRIYT